MSDTPDSVKEILAFTRKLAEMDPKDDAVSRAVKGLESQIAILREQMKGTRSWAKDSMSSDIEYLQEEIKRMKAAAEIPAKNWQRVISILDGLHRAATLAVRPQNSEVAPRIKEITAKVAGLFKEIDTAEDIAEKSLEEIEKAVANMYGDQSKNSTYYKLDTKGHHAEKYDKEPYKEALKRAEGWQGSAEKSSK